MKISPCHEITGAKASAGAGGLRTDAVRNLRASGRRARLLAWALPVALAGCSEPYSPVLELWPEAGGPPSGSTGDASAGEASTGGPEAGPEDAGGVPPPRDSGSPPTDSSIPPTPDAGSSPDAGGTDDSGGSDAGDDVGTEPPDTGPPDTGQPPPPCSLSVTVTTVTDNGEFSPANVGAIWIAQPSGAFVKTLAAWGSTRINRLTLWSSTTAQAGTSRNTVDAVTGATLQSHKSHSVSWTCTDTNEAIVPDGAYRVYFEMDDSNSPGPNTYVDFTKGPSGQTLTPADAPNFTGIQLVFVP